MTTVSPEVIERLPKPQDDWLAKTANECAKQCETWPEFRRLAAINFNQPTQGE